MKTKDIVFVLFGSTGDLSYRKLMPSFQKLFKDNMLDENIEVIAVGRRDYNNNDYFNYLKDINKELDIDVLSEFITYYKMQITNDEEYEGLKNYIDKISNKNTKIITYMAIAPYLFLDVARYISKHQIIEKGNLNQTVIFEKPFGESFNSSKKLNNELWNIFDEKQIYRIDHYLAKTMIQQITNLRFYNDEIKEFFDIEAIESVRLIIKEKDGILGRGDFYESSGALRDMVQSHLLQTIALLSMNNPKVLSNENVTKEKIKALNNLTIKHDDIVLGQYVGYLNEKDVSPNSKTETLAFLKFYNNYNNFKNIPLYIMTGKMLGKKESNIIIKYKDNVKNKELNICFDPENKITLIGDNNTDLTRYIKESNNKYDDYDKLILDAINQDKTLFVSGKEVEASWKIIDDIYSKDINVVKYKDYEDISSIIKDKFKINI